jgi:hypothetical protein
MHHGAVIMAGVIDEDVSEEGGVLGAGAEKTVRGLEHDDVDVVHIGSLPEDVVLLRGLVDALDREVRMVTGVDPHRDARDGEVPAVGGAVEEDVDAVVAPDPVHLPRRLQGAALRLQDDARAVVVGVEVRAVRAVPQPHERPVGEQVHGPRWWCFSFGGGRRRPTTATGVGFSRAEGVRIRTFEVRSDASCPLVSCPHGGGFAVPSFLSKPARLFYRAGFGPGPKTGLRAGLTGLVLFGHL